MCLKGEGSYQIDCDRKGEWVGQPGVRTSWMSKPWKQKAQATKLLRFMFCVSQLWTCPWQSQAEPWPWRVSCLPDRLSSEHSEHVASSYFSLFWLTCPSFKQSCPHYTFITLQDFHRWYGSWIYIYFGPVLALPGPSSTHCTGMCLLYSVSCLIVVWGLMLFFLSPYARQLTVPQRTVCSCSFWLHFLKPNLVSCFEHNVSFHI